jgi:hypothetical protein
MSAQTWVAVYGVDDAGATSARVGTGLLVHPLLVLLRPPLSGRIAAGHGPTGLRLGIASPAEPGIVEVIDADRVHVETREEPGEPLVALELCGAAASPTDEVPTLDGARDRNEAIAALERLLQVDPGTATDDSPDQAVLVPPDRGGGGNEDRSVFCKLLGWACPPRN